MSPLTLILAALLTGIGLGYGANYGQISLLNDAIEKSNAEAKEKLERAQDEVKIAQSKAEQFNNDLDKSRESYTKTAYAYDSKLDDLNRLFRNSRESCGSTSAASNSAKVLRDSATPSDVKTEIEQINRRRSEIRVEAESATREEIPVAEDAYNYAVEARKFALNKCGIVGR